jgi:putative oxidoreductase
VNTAIFVLRIVVGGLFVGHGLQKLFGWFDGPGIDGTAGMLHSLGYRPSRQHALLAGMTEAGGGLLLFFGLFTPLAAAAIVGVMLNATLSVHRPNGLWVQNNGYEYPLVLGATAFAIALGGGGKYSVDNAIGLHTGGWWGLLSLLFGLAVGATIYSSRRTQATEEPALAEQYDERRAA